MAGPRKISRRRSRKPRCADPAATRPSPILRRDQQPAISLHHPGGHRKDAAGPAQQIQRCGRGVLEPCPRPSHGRQAGHEKVPVPRTGPSYLARHSARGPSAGLDLATADGERLVQEILKRKHPPAAETGIEEHDWRALRRKVQEVRREAERQFSLEIDLRIPDYRLPMLARHLKLPVRRAVFDPCPAFAPRAAGRRP